MHAEYTCKTEWFQIHMRRDLFWHSPGCKVQSKVVIKYMLQIILYETFPLEYQLQIYIYILMFLFIFKNICNISIYFLFSCSCMMV